MIRHLFAAGLAAAIIAIPAHAQLTLGIGGGGGIGNGTASGKHGMAFAEIKPPVLPGLRADVTVYDAPEHSGRTNVTLNVVMAVPLPIVKPYALAGWGRYFIGEGESVNGWNAAVGVRAKLGIGVFAELRHHDKLPRKNLLTIGLAF